MDMTLFFLNAIQISLLEGFIGEINALLIDLIGNISSIVSKNYNDELRCIPVQIPIDGTVTYYSIGIMP